MQQVPLEAVYCIIECKLVIDSKALTETAEKIRAIRKLPRCPSRRRLTKGMDSGPLFTLFGFRLKASIGRCTESMMATMKSKTFLVGASAVGFLLVYALSSGPAVYLGERGLISRHIIQAAYRPLVAVVGGTPIYHEYINWWYKQGH